MPYQRDMVAAQGYSVGGLRSQGKDVRCPVVRKNAKIVFISSISRRRV